MSRGQSQSAICKELGISVMTLHRWRKEFNGHVDVPGKAGLATQREPRLKQQMEDLLLENQRLRRIVTDLMLEKAKLEEASSQQATAAN